jgi:nicotinamidase-related amidase
MSQTALLIIDVQKTLVDEPPRVHEPDRLLAALRELIERARAASVPVIYVVDDEVDAPGSPGWDVHPALGRVASELRVSKTACDAFHETTLAAELAARGITRLVVAGCKSQYCVDSTCRRAVTLGFPVVLVADAHSTNARAHLSAEAIIAHENATLDGFGVNGPPGQGPIEIRVVAAAALDFVALARA